MSVNGKQKGSEFERQICKALSLWVSKGANVDLYWRSAMSGGRATVAKGTVRQAGDITAVAPEGHILTDAFYIECKAYKDIDLNCLVTGKGTLLNFWRIACKEAVKYDRTAMLIFKRNHWPVIVCMQEAGRRALDLGRERELLRSGSMVLFKFNAMVSKEFSLR